MTGHCIKCKQNINGRELLICSTCDKTYDLTCANVSYQRFNLMTTNNKENWKCPSCWLDFHKYHDQNNITHRKKIIVNISTENSFSSLDEEETEITSNTLDLNRSCPGPTFCHESDLQELRTEIDRLNQKLESADNEIITLLQENSILQKQLEKHKLQNKQLMQLCKAPNTRLSLTPNNRHSSQKKKESKRILLNSSSFEISTPNVREQYTPKDGATSSQKSKETFTYPNPLQQDRPHIQHNMSIISTNNRNRILTTATSAIQNTGICHFLTPNVGLHQLLADLEKKVQNYTLHDSCVIVIGEKDFETSMDYRSLVNSLRTELLKIQNTNVFICLPTFRHGWSENVIYNSRVDIFNNLLYSDNIVHEYAYILDSNKNLTYDNRMFTKFKGNLNNKGLQQIFRDLSSLINDVMLENLYNLPTSPINNNNSNKQNSPNNSTDFFRILQ